MLLKKSDLGEIRLLPQTENVANSPITTLRGASTLLLAHVSSRYSDELVEFNLFIFNKSGINRIRDLFHALILFKLVNLK